MRGGGFQSAVFEVENTSDAAPLSAEEETSGEQSLEGSTDLQDTQDSTIPLTTENELLGEQAQDVLLDDTLVTPAIEASGEDEAIVVSVGAGLGLTTFAGEPPVMNGLAWKIFKASDDSEPSRDQGPNPADYSIGIPHWQEYYAVLNFDIHAYSGEQLHDGDRLSIPFLPQNFYYATTAAEQLMAPDGITVLGTWWIDAATKTLEIELGADSEGFTVLTNCTITTAKTLRANRTTNVDIVLTNTVGGVSHDYMYLIVPRNPSSYAVSKVLNITTNTTARWHIYTSRDLTDQLYLNDGDSLSFNNQTSYILEDEIPASEGVTGVDDFKVIANVLYIMSETDKRSATMEGTHALTSDVTSAFARVMQIGGEDYATFKGRINPMQYGVYETPGGDFKIVANLGDASSPSFPLKIANIWPNLEQSLTDNGKITTNEVAVIANALRSTNVIHGNATDLMFGFTATYQQSFVDTIKTNTVESTLVRDGNTITRSSTRTATLRAGSGAAVPASHQATIAKADVVSGAPLEGVVFKVQHSIDGGTNWIDTSHSDLTTDVDGEATTGVLSPGLYRFIEVIPLPGYDLSSAIYISSTGEANGVFTINSLDTVGVVVTATNTPLDYTVHYDINGATSGAIADKTNVKYWDDDLLPTSNPTKPGSTFSHWIVEDSGTAGTYNGDTATSAKKYSEMADDADTAEITLKAIWTANTYTVNYDTNGGDPSTISPLTSVLWGDDDLLPISNPTKEGSIFAGWQVSVGGTVGTAATSTSKYSDLATDDTVTSVTLQAQWTANSYTINYDTNGGDPATIAPLTGVLWDDDDLLPASNPTKDGFIFSHWEVSNSGATGTHVGDVAASASKYSELADDDATTEITLKAQWTAKTAESEVVPTVTKTLTGVMSTSEAFSFELSLTAGDPAGITLPAATTIATAPMTSGSEVANFANIAFSKVGTYTLEITEVAGNTKNLTYDSAVYTLTYTVTEDAAVYIVSAPVIAKDGDPAQAVEFVNIYTAPKVPGMDFTKQVDKPTATPGDTLTYTITLKNTGEVDLLNITVTDPLDTRLAFVSADNAGVLTTAAGKDTISWVIDELKVGESIALTFVVKIKEDAALEPSILNTASAKDSSSGKDTPTNTVETKLTSPAGTTPTPPGDNPGSTKPGTKPGGMPITGDSILLALVCTALLSLGAVLTVTGIKRRKAKENTYTPRHH